MVTTNLALFGYCVSHTKHEPCPELHGVYTEKEASPRERFLHPTAPGASNLAIALRGPTKTSARSAATSEDTIPEDRSDRAKRKLRCVNFRESSKL